MASTRPRQGRHIRVGTVALRARVGKRRQRTYAVHDLRRRALYAFSLHLGLHHLASRRLASKAHPAPSARLVVPLGRPMLLAAAVAGPPLTALRAERVIALHVPALDHRAPARPHGIPGGARQWALTHPPHSSAKRRITSPAFGMLPPGGAHSVARLAGASTRPHWPQHSALASAQRCRISTLRRPPRARVFVGVGRVGINSTAGGLTDYLRATTERQTSCRGTAPSHGLARWRRCVLRLPCSRSTFRFRRN